MANSYLLSVPTDALRLSARVRAAIRRRRATRRRSRRAANRASARRATHTSRSIMVTRHIAGIVPATHPWSCWTLGRRGIFALSTGLPTMGFAMLDKSPGIPSPAPHVTPRKERERLAEYLK